MNRDIYTQKYCQFLDEGITQCRASCYLDDLLKENQSDEPVAKIGSSSQQKMSELISQEIVIFFNETKLDKHQSFFDSDPYQFDFLQFIFHPPKV